MPSGAPADAVRAAGRRYAATHPFRAVIDIRREELPQALWMFAYFLLVITTFWVLKPLKKGLFVTYYDVAGFDLYGWHFIAPEAELLAKSANVFVAYLAVVVFSVLSNHYRRQQLTLIFSTFFGVSFAVYAVLLDRPGATTVWTFYLLGDLFNSLMLVTFFAFLNDIVTSDAAKRTYGLVGLGGVLGGVIGSTMVVGLSHALSLATWLLACTVAMAAVASIGVVVGGLHARRIVGDGAALRETQAAERRSTSHGGNPAVEGMRLVARSPYLLAIVAIVGTYEMVSTILDFQFSATMSHYLDGPAIGRGIGLAFAAMNWTALLVQIFVTSHVMRHHGVAVALSILPVALLLGAGSFLIAPVLIIGALIPALDGGLQYSINQSAKESLYVPTTRDEKYRLFA